MNDPEPKLMKREEKMYPRLTDHEPCARCFGYSLLFTSGTTWKGDTLSAIL